MSDTTFYKGFFVFLLSSVIIIGVLSFVTPVTAITRLSLITDVTQENDTYFIQRDGSGRLEVTYSVYEMVKIGDNCKIAWEPPYIFAPKLGTRAFCEDGQAYKVSGENNE